MQNQNVLIIFVAAASSIVIGLIMGYHLQNITRRADSSAKDTSSKEDSQKKEADSDKQKKLLEEEKLKEVEQKENIREGIRQRMGRIPSQVCIEDLIEVRGKEVPAKYSVPRPFQHEKVVVGAHVDISVIPGFKYRVRLNGTRQLLFGGKPLTLLSIGMGYGRRFTFESNRDPLEENDNYFWSDNNQEGYAFSVCAIEENAEFFLVHPDTLKSIATLRFKSVSQEQFELESHLRGSDGITPLITTDKGLVGIPIEKESVRKDVDIEGVASISFVDHDEIGLPPNLAGKVWEDVKIVATAIVVKGPGPRAVAETQGLIEVSICRTAEAHPESITGIFGALCVSPDHLSSLQVSAMPTTPRSNSTPKLF